jgi:hypothetical protein
VPGQAYVARESVGFEDSPDVSRGLAAEAAGLLVPGWSRAVPGVTTTRMSGSAHGSVGAGRWAVTVAAAFVVVQFGRLLPPCADRVGEPTA